MVDGADGVADVVKQMRVCCAICESDEGEAGGERGSELNFTAKGPISLQPSHKAQQSVHSST